MSGCGILVCLPIYFFPLPQIDGMLHKGSDLVLFTCLYLQGLQLCLAHSRFTVNICWMNGCRNGVRFQGSWGAWTLQAQMKECWEEQLLLGYLGPSVRQIWRQIHSKGQPWVCSPFTPCPSLHSPTYITRSCLSFQEEAILLTVPLPAV